MLSYASCHVLCITVRVNKLTLIYMEKGLSEFAGEQWLRKVSEKLLHHVGYVICTLILIVYALWRTFTHLSQSLNARLHTRLTEKPHLSTKHS